jgi:hypothetical protein
MLGDVRRRLASDEPLDLLAEVSSLLNVVDLRRLPPMERARAASELPTLAELVASFCEIDCVETTALLAGFAHLADDELVRHRARRALAERRYPLPDWLRRLGDSTVTGVVSMEHVLRDGDNLMVGLRLGSGHPLTLVTYVDHNLGTLVKDAFVIPETLDDVVEDMRSKADDPDVVFAPLPPADGRARIEQAIEMGAMTVPPFETDTWPACRPLLEWALRMLPEGGTGFVRPSWSEEERQELARRFFASAHGRPFDDDDLRGLLPIVLLFACDYGPGDPLRWSPTAVELLLDFVPRKVMAPAAELQALPDLVRAFVAFCHAERDIRPSLTRDTLAAVDRFAPEYLDTVRTPGPRSLSQAAVAAAIRSGELGPLADLPPEVTAALAEALDEWDEDDWDEEEEEEEDDDWDEDDEEAMARMAELLDTSTAGMGRRMLHLLTEQVGGTEALERLDTVPLPDEPFDWSVVPDDVAPVVGQVLAHCDACCDERLDVEYRTACRRLLAKVVAGDPQVFRRRGRPETAAAAICWAVGKANDLFFSGHAGPSTTATELMGFFGISSGGVSQRAGTLLRAAGWPSWYGGEVNFGDPGLLVSSRRASIISRRDRARQWMAD